jgi:hypothetical protein
MIIHLTHGQQFDSLCTWETATRLCASFLRPTFAPTVSVPFGLSGLT